jgi:hypothetical protein
MAAIKRIPQRKCLGCGVSKNKSDLIRVVRSAEKDGGADSVSVSVDLKGKKSGRGAYICKDESCLKKAVKAKKFDRGLDVKISSDVLETLLSQIKESE